MNKRRNQLEEGAGERSRQRERYKAVGMRLKRYREAKGYTRETFSEALDLSANYVSAVERGVKMLSFDKFIEAVNLLGISADDLLEDILTVGGRLKAACLQDRLDTLSVREQRRILLVVETLIDTAEDA